MIYEDKYRTALLQLVDSFEYELCECGHDVQAHVFAPDPLGLPHAWCLLEPTQTEPNLAQLESDTDRWEDDGGAVVTEENK